MADAPDPESSLAAALGLYESELRAAVAKFNPEAALAALGLDGPALKATSAKFASIDFSPPVTMHRLDGMESLMPVVELPAAGRPKGPSPETAYLVEALTRRLAAAGDGAKPTTVAVEICKALGYTGEQQLKNMADGLVRAYRRDQAQRFK
jgi:hypothetical protein